MCSLILSASKCTKEGDNCHHNIVFKNNSSKSIIFAIPIFGFGQAVPPPNAEIKCRLDGQEIKPGETGKYRPYRRCIETSMAGNYIEDIYIVDPNGFNDKNIMYACDSIAYKNTILMRYETTLENLKATNFTVTYP